MRKSARVTSTGTSLVSTENVFTGGGVGGVLPLFGRQVPRRGERPPLTRSPCCCYLPGSLDRRKRSPSSGHPWPQDGSRHPAGTSAALRAPDRQPPHSANVPGGRSPRRSLGYSCRTGMLSGTRRENAEGSVGPRGGAGGKKTRREGKHRPASPLGPT